MCHCIFDFCDSLFEEIKKKKLIVQWLYQDGEGDSDNIEEG